MWTILGYVLFGLTLWVCGVSWFLGGILSLGSLYRGIHNRYPDGMTGEEYQDGGRRALKLFLMGCLGLVWLYLPTLFIPREPYELEETLIPVSISIGPAEIVLRDAEGQRFSRRHDGLLFEEGDTSSVTVSLKTTGHRVNEESWYGQLCSYTNAWNSSKRVEAKVLYPRGKASDVLELIKL